MTAHTTDKTPVTLLGLGAMGTALARAWLAAGHPTTVWNRTPARADALAAEGARTATAAAAAIAAGGGPVVLCLLDDASVGETLADADLAGRDVVNLTTCTPAQARTRAAWVRERGARYLDGGIMAIPPMIGVPEAGGYVFYSGPREVYDRHREVLAVPAGTTYAGADPGFAALYDVALLSAMYGMFAGLTHAFALVRGEDVDQAEFAGLVAGWLTAMAPAAAQGMAAELAKEAQGPENPAQSTEEVASLAMQVAGTPTFLDTARGQGVSPELLSPYFELMRRALADPGRGMVDLLR